MKKITGLIISAALIFGAVPAVHAAEAKIQYKDLGEKEYEISDKLTITDKEEADALLFTLLVTDAIDTADGDSIDVDFTKSGGKNITINIARSGDEIESLSFTPYEPGSLNTIVNPQAIDFYFEDNKPAEGLESVAYFSNLKLGYFPGPEDIGLPDDDGMYKITAQGCLAYAGDKPLADYRAGLGTELTFKLEKPLADNENVSWAVQYPNGNHFYQFKEAEDGQSITLEMPLNDIIVTAERGEIISDNELNTGEMKFDDVKESDWFYGAVKEMFDNGFMSGITSTEYRPKSEGTRGEIVDVLYRIDGAPAVSGKPGFSDIGADSDLADAVVWATERGITAGYPDGTFKPDQSVSRQELAQFVYKYVQYKGAGFTGAWYFPLDFKDAGEVGSWADEAVHWCVMNEIISGMGDGTIAPKGTTTRAQLASLFNRLRKLDFTVQGDPPVDEQRFANMPLGTYESQEMAREVTIFGDGTFEMLGGHGVEDPEPFKGTWEAKSIETDKDMYADAVYFYIDGEEFMHWIYDGEKFIIGPWQGKGALYEHMVRTQRPEISIEGTWLKPDTDSSEIDRFVFKDGKWEAFSADGKTAAAGIYSPVSGEQNTYKLIDASGKTYDTVETFFNDFGNCVFFQSTEIFYITESAVKG